MPAASRRELWWWPAATTAERAAASTPGWAAHVETVLAGRFAEPDARREPVPGDRPAETERELVFAPVIRPFVSACLGELAESLRLVDCDVDAVLADVRAGVEAGLCRVAARTLVRELAAARDRGELCGADPRERFRSFVAATSRPAGLRALLSRYPVLARMLAIQSRLRVRAATELIERLAADREQLAVTLFDGADPGTLTGLGVGAGDVHNAGRSVTVVRFTDDRRVVYKPRPTAIDARFAAMVSRMGELVGDPGLRAAQVLVRPRYGWAEYIAERPCEDASAVARFYRRQGVLLALLHVLNVVDAHCQNVVAHGDLPVLVDVETMLHPTLPVTAAAGGADPARAMLCASVARTAMLPSLTVGEAGTLDLSGLGGDTGRLPSARLRFVDAGTDTMHAVRAADWFPGAANRPRLVGMARPVDPTRYEPEFADGFHVAYRALATDRASWTGLLSSGAGEQVRILVRDTRTYARVLDECTHPDVLHDGASHEAALSSLGQQVDTDLAGKVLESEVAQLRDGDVPVFAADIDDTALRGPDGAVLATLPYPPLSGAQASVERLCDADLATQSWVLRASFATRAPVRAAASRRIRTHRPAAARADADGVLALARSVGDELAAAANHDGRRSNWAGLRSLDERTWSVLPLGGDLGTGYPGVAVFLAQLAELTGVARYGELAIRALTDLGDLLAMLGAEPSYASAVGSGAHDGAAGIAYALARVGRLLDQPALSARAEDAITVITLADDPARLDIAGGRAGAVLGLLGVHQDTGSVAARSAAARLAGLLAEVPAPSQPGLLHGAAGVALALARAGTVLDRPDLMAAAVARMPAGDGNGGAGWCRGGSGLLMARAELVPAPAPDHFGLAALVSHTLDSGDWSPCHGLGGALETVVALRGAGSPAAARARRSTIGLVLDQAEQSGWRCGTPGGVPTPGLLNGLAGIGLSLLRLACPDRVPSALSLQAAPARSREPEPQSEAVRKMAVTAR